MADQDEREIELLSLSAIYPELVFDISTKSASLELPIAPADGLIVRFTPDHPDQSGSTEAAHRSGAPHVERDVRLSHLPSLLLQIALPRKYPAESPPEVHLSSQRGWLPQSKVAELEREAETLWQEYCCGPILFVYIEHLTECALRGLDFDQTAAGCLVLSDELAQDLAKFDAESKISVFHAGTYDCGICIEPKKGWDCYQLRDCAHVFCKECLQGFYNNAITEGDVAAVRCLAPDCGKTTAVGRPGRKPGRTLHPQELLAMGIEQKAVRRFVEMKRKKKQEADRKNVYCPRTWCQGAARSRKYPPIPSDLSHYVDLDSDDEDETVASATHAASSPEERVAICEKCDFAFCRICFKSWHGVFARCIPRDPNELSTEEKASWDYIRQSTSACPTCTAPTQKTMGCNHMQCFQCRTHFCYLCTSWLDAQNPYQHFNKPGTECYQRLWELEEGDEGEVPAPPHEREAALAEGFAMEQLLEARMRDLFQGPYANEQDLEQNRLVEDRPRPNVDAPVAPRRDRRENGHGGHRNAFPRDPQANGNGHAFRNYGRQRRGRNR